MIIPAPYYQDEAVVIYHGDCRDLAPHIPRPDGVITDPPYSERTHSGARTDGGGGGVRSLVDFSSVSADLIRSTFSVFAPKRWLVATCDFMHAADLYRDPPDGLEAIRIGAWVKRNPCPQFTGDRPGQGWEAVILLHPPGRKKWSGGGKAATWTSTVSHGLHPTEKPLYLISEWVRLFTDPGETILDPFMGSGTTLRAAKDLGRKAIGIEIDEKYCEIAARRMAQEVLPL